MHRQTDLARQARPCFPFSIPFDSPCSRPGSRFSFRGLLAMPCIILLTLVTNLRLPALCPAGIDHTLMTRAFFTFCLGRLCQACLWIFLLLLSLMNAHVENENEFGGWPCFRRPAPSLDLPTHLCISFAPIYTPLAFFSLRLVRGVRRCDGYDVCSWMRVVVVCITKRRACYAVWYARCTGCWLLFLPSSPC